MRIGTVETEDGVTGRVEAFGDNIIPATGAALDAFVGPLAIGARFLGPEGAR